MSISPPSSPHARFIEPALRDRLISSLQRQFEQQIGSDEVEDAYGHMLEQLSKMPLEKVSSIKNPATWMFVGMRNEIDERLSRHSASNVHFGDLADSDVLDEVLSDNDDLVSGSVIGRETAGERLALVAELVWLKFTGTDGQIAARVLLEEAKPHAVAAELGLDPAHVQIVAHKAQQERRLLERKLKENPEFRCWRLRKHMSTYYAEGEVSLALRAHWVTCAKCRAARRVVRVHTYAALSPLLTGAAAATGGGGVLARILHHATHPRRTARRLLRPAAHAGAKTGASSSQAATIGATVTSKAAVVAAVAAVGTSAAGAATVAVVQHFSHRPPARAISHHRSVPTLTPSNPAPASASSPELLRASSEPRHAHQSVKRVAKHSKRRVKPKHKLRHQARKVTSNVVAAAPAPAPTTPAPAPAPTTTPVAPVTTTTQAAPVATTPPAPPATPTSTATSPSTGGSVRNPSYSTPNAP